MKADYLHNWWHCEVIKVFWLKIQSEIKLITNIDLPFMAEAFLLNIFAITRLDLDSSDTVSTLLTVAKALVALKWHDNKPLSISMWQNKLLEYFVLSKLEFSSSEKCSSRPFQNFVAVWLLILEYLNSNHMFLDQDHYKNLLYF